MDQNNASNIAVPLEELTQYSMKTGKNADMDLIKSTATRKIASKTNHLKVAKGNQISDESSQISSSRGSNSEIQQKSSDYPSSSSLPVESVSSSAACVKGVDELNSRPKRKKITQKSKK